MRQITYLSLFLVCLLLRTDPLRVPQTFYWVSIVAFHVLFLNARLSQLYFALGLSNAVRSKTNNSR